MSILDTWQNAPKGEELLKSVDTSVIKTQEPKSAIIDPTNANGILGVRQKPLVVPFETLRRMANVPAISAIILTRQNQVARFTRRPRFDGDIGFKVGLKDAKQKMTEADRKEAFRIEEFFLNTGGVKNAKRKDNFNKIVRKLVRDTLSLDVLAWENVLNMKGELAEIWAVDGATIELVSNAPMGDGASPIVYMPTTRRGMRDAGDIAYVQRLNGQIVAEYTEEELCYGIRNPRTDIEFADFGQSELEVLIEIITSIMNSVRYNSSYFNSSSLPQGILEIVGKYQEKHFEAFKRHWKNLTSGASGKWATPVIAMEDGQGVKFTNFKNSNRDMEFNQFLEFLFNIACAVYQINPDEVGFKSWTSGSGMGQTDNTEAKIDNSQDKGFIPLMNFLSDHFNSEIVDRMNPEFAFYWVGLDEDNEDAKWQRITTKLQSGVVTVAQVRKEEDMDDEDIINPATGKPWLWTQAPGNPQLIQVFMAESGLQQQPGQDGSDPNAEADQQQAQADDAHGKAMETSDDTHNKELEKMDKQHQQTKELEDVKHKNTMELEKFKAKNAPKPAPAKGKNMKKSLTETDDAIEIEIDWSDY